MTGASGYFLSLISTLCTPFICAFFPSCSFLLTYWHHCEAVLPELPNTAGNLCLFLERALRGIGETFSYLYGFICVCSHSCIYVGFCMRVCYMRRNVKTNANIFHLCVSNQFILTRILLRQKRIGWRQGREEKRKGRKRQEEDRAVWRKKKRGAYKERD